MSTKDSIVRGSQRSTWHVAGLALGAALLMGASARADGDFENGFEDQMGRILAFEAVQAAKAVLFYGAPVPVPVAAPYAAAGYYAPVVEYPVPVATVVAGQFWQPWYGSSHSHRGGHYYQPRHHYQQPRHTGHHRHDRHCGHGGSQGGWERGHRYGYRDDHRGYGYRHRDDDDRGHGRGHGRSSGRDRGRGDSRGRYARY